MRTAAQSNWLALQVHQSRGRRERLVRGQQKRKQRRNQRTQVQGAFRLEGLLQPLQCDRSRAPGVKGNDAVDAMAAYDEASFLQIVCPLRHWFRDGAIYDCSDVVLFVLLLLQRAR